MEIQITLPTRDRQIASDFISSEQALLEATWEKGKFRKLSDEASSSSRYLLLFPTFVLPGVDTIAPEIEVEFSYESGKIEMRSGNWTIKSSSGKILKDSRFMQTFNIKLFGELAIAPLVLKSPSSSISRSSSSSSSSISLGSIGSNLPSVVLTGWVEYDVQGEKPSAFRTAPPFVLDVTIKLIQETVSDYATTQFSSRLLRAFRAYLMQLLTQQAQDARKGTSS